MSYRTREKFHPSVRLYVRTAPPDPDSSPLEAGQGHPEAGLGLFEADLGLPEAGYGLQRLAWVSLRLAWPYFRPNCASWRIAGADIYPPAQA